MKLPQKVIAETASVKGNQDWPFWIISADGVNCVAECMDAIGLARPPGFVLLPGREFAENLAKAYNDWMANKPPE